MAMLQLRDNSEKTCPTEAEIKEYLPLLSIANRNIPELLKQYGDNLLIYPHSFNKCEDLKKDSCILSTQSTVKGGRCTELTLKTGNLAGFIGVGGTSLSICSRFASDAEEDFFLHYMLQRILNLNVVNLAHSAAEEQLFNFLLYLFPKALNEALAQGLYKEYVRRDYNDANVRGTININRHLRQNLPFNGRIAYRTREFSHDNKLTELIRHTIEYIRTSSLGRSVLENDAQTRESVAQIVATTPRYSLSEREKLIRSNSKPLFHPYFSRYAPLQRLCLAILRHRKIKYGANDEQIYGVLFDLADLWEEYLATILTPIGFTHPNNRKHTQPVYLAEDNGLKRYPDFHSGEAGVVIDAKYKRNVSNRDDIHQIIAYMYRLKSRLGVCIHPFAPSDAPTTAPNAPKDTTDCQNNTNNSPNKNYKLLGYGEESNSELCTYPFPIPQSASDYADFKEQISQSEAELSAYATEQLFPSK